MTTILAAFAIFLLVLAAGSEHGRRNRYQADRRLRQMSGHSDGEKRVRSQAAVRLQHIGDRMLRRSKKADKLAEMMMLGGLRAPGSTAIYQASRVLAAVLLAAISFIVISALAGPDFGVFGAIYFAVIGLFVPRFWLKRQISQRKQRIQRAIPDMLDLMVVCVEAGLGLNQAIVRVARELGPFSPDMAEELRILNLELKTGTSDEVAFRNLSARTGVADIRSLASMLIQARRFGTEVGVALRVQSDSLRTKRRQRAEEAAAKTTIKLVFPLVLFIFPALFIVILGPVGIRIIETMGGM
jgi:tight adherence protein C